MPRVAAQMGPLMALERSWYCSDVGPSSALHPAAHMASKSMLLRARTEVKVSIEGTKTGTYLSCLIYTISSLPVHLYTVNSRSRRRDKVGMED